MNNSNTRNSFKNHSILIAPRIKDTSKILEQFCIKSKLKIFVEKPISNKSLEIKRLLKFKKRIFIGYNRIFYKNILYLKKKNINKSLVSVHSAESKFTQIKSNTCHLISIIIYLYGDLKIKNKIKGKNYYLCCLYNSKVNIIFTIYLNSSKNFEIEIIKNKKTFLIKPIEKLQVYENFKIDNLNGENFYNPKKIYEINEYKFTKNKPGFDGQWYAFKKLVDENKIFLNNISFGYKVIKLLENILK